MQKVIELKPVKESTSDYERMEARIKLAFKKLIYLPLLKEFDVPRSVITNDRDDLIKALQTGRITFNKATFKGQFDAKTSQALKKLGAKWDKKSSTFKLPKAKQPMEIREAISVSTLRFKERIARIDKRLSKIEPPKIKTSDLFETVIGKVDHEIKKSVKDLTVYPELSAGERAKIAEEWQNNMDLWINDFTEHEIVRLRKDIGKAVFSDNRHEAIIGSLQRSYGVTANKAKFLARQETSLLLAKFKETRYTKSGVNEYKWRCVAGSKNHPVRPSHKVLDGKVFRWDTPPITTEPNQPVRRNNPGQDYNCRCMAVPIVRFNP